MSETRGNAGSGEFGRGRRGRDRDDAGALTIGVLLIVVGALFLAAQAFQIDWEQYGWPMYVVLPGVLLLVLGLSISHEGGLGAAIPGGIVTSVGLVLAFQNATETYASWAYMWALVAPGSVGVTIALYGLLHRRPDLLDSGLRTATVGLGLFIGFGLFFENIVQIDRAHPSSILRDGMPFVAVALGALIVLWSLIPHPRPAGRRPDLDGDWREVPPPPRA